MRVTKIVFAVLMLFLPLVIWGQGVVKRTTKKPKKQQQTETLTSKTHAPKNSEEAGYDVTFICNVSTAALFIDGIASGTASGKRFMKTGTHEIELLADGYDAIKQTVLVNSNTKSYAFTMELSSVILRLIDNMVHVEGGTYVMGVSSEKESDSYKFDMPSHIVVLSSFAIGKYEVTQKEWTLLMGDNPSQFKGENLPVENVNWYDCQEFIKKLNSITGKHFRLPTEAEWEYAAKGGMKSEGYKYAGSNTLNLVGWNKNNSGARTHEVGGKLPNELDLYDMTGNVFEWCQDWSGRYTSVLQSDPTGPSKGDSRIIRGNAWTSGEHQSRVTNRSGSHPKNQNSAFGFRLAL